MSSLKIHKILAILTLIILLCLTSIVQADQTNWQQEEVNWRITGGGRIKAIRHPADKEPHFLDKSIKSYSKVIQKNILPERYLSNAAFDNLFAIPSVAANIINSPPIDGFIPQIAVAVTDKRSDDFDWVAETHNSVEGRYLTDDPNTNFVIGIFDTGASFHLMGYDAAVRTGIYDADLLTDNVVEIIGATNSLLARVSYPLAVFMDGLVAIDPNTMTLNDANMVGQSNVSIVVGDVPGPNQPGLPTAIGSPMSVNFVTAINNNNVITVTFDGNEYTSPDIRFYDRYDPQIPDYNSQIPLNLIPAGAYNIQYIPDLDAIMDFVFIPGQPSIIVGNSAQSLFFVNSVDLYNNTYTAIDKTRFMLDTGAQITVISSGVGSRLALDPANPDFEVEIEDATGEITINPGFYLDSIEIPGLGQWLRYTNVPVVLLDVASPEGGTLDGIIGMNLFVYYNMVLHGGGLFGQENPSLEFELIPSILAGDIAPENGDGIVDFRDISAMARAWLSTPDSPNWNPLADLAPASPDGIIDFRDFTEFADYWHAYILP